MVPSAPAEGTLQHYSQLASCLRVKRNTLTEEVGNQATRRRERVGWVGGRVDKNKYYLYMQIFVAK
jgi:hypothetical protein